MIIFDGTNPGTIEVSLANALQMGVNDFSIIFIDYYISNINDLDNVSLNGFIEFLNGNGFEIDADSIYVDKVMFFHKTSVIDKGRSILETGLTNLREVLVGDTTLSKYLQSKGIIFSIENGVPYINNDSVVEIVKKHADDNYWKVKGIKSISHRLLSDWCLDGYLFLNGALRENEYAHIKNKSEFFYSLNEWMPNISREWEMSSVSYIVKCEVDIDWLDVMGDYNHRLENNEKSTYILNKAVYCAVDSLRNTFSQAQWHAPVEYLYLHQNLSIPPDRIMELIKY